jgi:threonine/homoserine/homoserine lactone efflux protein
VTALVLGLVCGFVGSIPIAGPTAVLVLERALQGHPVQAFEIAVGAAFAEAVYAAFAFLGMTAALSRFPWLTPASRIAGGVILVGLGLYLALSRRDPLPPHKPELGEAPRRFGGKILVGLLATGVNPTLLATWSAVVTALHATALLAIEPLDAAPFAVGVAAGIVAWFGALILLVQKFRNRVGETALRRLVRWMGWLLVAAGVAILVNLVRRALVMG